MWESIFLIEIMHEVWLFKLAKKGQTYKLWFFHVFFQKNVTEVWNPVLYA